MKALQGMAHHVTENSRQMNELASDIEQIKGLLNAILTEVRQLKGGASSSTVKAMQDKMAQAARSNSQRF